MGSFEVRVWSIRKRKGRSPFQLRWIVGDTPHAESFLTRALADSFRNKLLTAARAGEEFDAVTGQPVAWGREVSWHDHARDFAASRWARSAPGSRRTRAVALAAVTVALTAGKRGRPDVRVLRRALISWAYGPHGVPLVGPDGAVRPPQPLTPPADIAAALAWVARSSPPVAALRDLSTVRGVLDALTLNPDGNASAATTIATRRSLFYNAVGRAVELGLLGSNPLDAVQWTRPKMTQAVDRRVVANPTQVAAILAAVPHVAPKVGGGLVAFYGCLYYAGVRPSEAIGLAATDCELPKQGWGQITLGGSTPYTSVTWGDTGQSRERRSLKHRANGAVRVIPIPPQLVALLRHHQDTYGTAEDGRLFRTLHGGPLQSPVYGRVWRKARARALSRAQVASPLAKRPYDLRHACASLWLAGGVSVTDVAERLGHSVETLLKVYAACIDGNSDRNNALIAAALGGAADTANESATDSPVTSGNTPTEPNDQPKAA